MAKGTHLVPTGRYVNSPGYDYFRGEDGKIQMRFNQERKVAVMANPTIASIIQKEVTGG